MARKVKFPLRMADGADVRNLDELKEHFDIESVVGYFNDGRLLAWLQARYYDDEAYKVELLTKGDKDLHKKLCGIFGVDLVIEELDVEEIARRQERLNRLKQYTDDREILERVDIVAFDQEDLSDLLDENKPLIYLCNNKFVIPLRETHKTYIGVGKAVAIIRSNKPIDFDALNIEFRNVIFDDKYAALISEHKKEQKLTEKKLRDDKKASLPKKIYDEGDAARNSEDYETALEKFKKAAELNYPAAFSAIGHMYLYGHGVDKDINEARRWFKLGMEKKDEDSFWWYIYTFSDSNYDNIVSTENEKHEAFRLVRRMSELDGENNAAINGLAYCYKEGIGVSKNPEKAFELYERSANAGDTLAMMELAYMLESGKDVRKNLNKAIEWAKKAAEAGYGYAYHFLGRIYYNEYDNDYNRFLSDIYDSDELELKDNQKAGTYFRKGAEAGDTNCMTTIATMCERGIGMAKNENLAFKWYLRAAEAGDYFGMLETGKCYFEGRGTKKNLNDAEYWLKKSAESGLGMKEYADLLFERYSSDALNWYKKAFEKIDVSTSYGEKEAGEVAYKIYKIYKEGQCGVTKSKSDADYWEGKYKSLGYKPDDGCFITTAVCDSFGKPDDCYELTTFRKFRDDWLKAQPDGKSLIAEYYAIAPRIVANINRLTNAAQIYKTIWEKYLAPCLISIESGNNQACKQFYTDMVTSLKKKFLED